MWSNWWLLSMFKLFPLNPCEKKLLRSLIIFFIILDDWLSHSASCLILDTVTLIPRCVREGISDLRLQHVHHLSHGPNHTIKTVSFRQLNLFFKHLYHFLDCKLTRCSRVSHLVNNHVEENLCIFKLNLKLLNLFAVIFLHLC